MAKRHIVSSASDSVHAPAWPVVPQAIPGLSPVPWWGTLFPLAVVLLVNGVKEAFDDFWRHKADEQVHGRGSACSGRVSRWVLQQNEHFVGAGGCTDVDQYEVWESFCTPCWSGQARD